MKRTLSSYLIYPKFQILLISIQIFFYAVFSLVSLFKIHSSFAHFKELILSLDIPVTHPIFQFVSKQEASIYPGLIVISLTSFFIFTVFSFVLSHRLAGPIVRTTEYLKSVADSKRVTHELEFRKNDFFSDFPGVLNRALKAVQSREE